MSKRYQSRTASYIKRGIALLIVLLIIGFLGFQGWRVWNFYRAVNGEIPPQLPDPDDYPVKGVDISYYQGEIDWNVLSSEDHVKFAFIKATEGSNHQDERFTENWENARNAGVYVGAYHFVSFESSGETQADNFISLVPKQANSLPPVLDLELYNEEVMANPPSKEKVHQILDAMIEKLEAYYGVKPVIYTSSNLYMKYIFGSYWSCDLWLSNTKCEPLARWTFWQYSYEGYLSGFAADNIPVDLNVYNGSEKDFYEHFGLSPDFAVYKKENAS
ncbi:MAG: GH25 family lysozyme [Ruminococcus sp.]